MGKFNEILLTNDGRELQNKAQTGVPLTFTRVALGDGSLGTGDLEDLGALISEKMSLDISEIKTTGDGTSSITVGLTNRDIDGGFYIREIGLFANDPDKGEILYSVANAGDKADFLPRGNQSEAVEKTIEIITIVGNAENVTAVIDNSLVYASKADINNVVSQISGAITKISEVETIAKTSVVTRSRIPAGEITSDKLRTTHNADRIGLVNLQEEVIQAMAGETPVGTIVADGSVTVEKLAPKLQTMFIGEGAEW